MDPMAQPYHKDDVIEFAPYAMKGAIWLSGVVEKCWWGDDPGEEGWWLTIRLNDRRRFRVRPDECRRPERTIWAGGDAIDGVSPFDVNSVAIGLSAVAEAGCFTITGPRQNAHDVCGPSLKFHPDGRVEVSPNLSEDAIAEGIVETVIAQKDSFFQDGAAVLKRLVKLLVRNARTMEKRTV